MIDWVDINQTQLFKILDIIQYAFYLYVYLP